MQAYLVLLHLDGPNLSQTLARLAGRYVVLCSEG